MKISKNLMPQEIEVWYLIPSLRKEIAGFLINHFNFSQKEVSEVFGVTEAAVSQYVNLKRANEIKFSKADLSKIKDTASKISKDRKNFMKFLYALCVYFRKSEIICRLHRRKDKSISKKCRICMEN